MDIFAHCVYGMTACSRSGLAGGRKGSGTSWFRDRSVWWAAGFGLLPDLASLGFPFLLFLFAGMPGNFFRDLNPDWLISYRYAHSMLTALVVAIICVSEARENWEEAREWDERPRRSVADRR